MTIKGYHTSRFLGRQGPEFEFNAEDPLVGIEFEAEIENRTHAVDEVENTIIDGIGFHPEADGSLSAEYGVEFVSVPMPASLSLKEGGPLDSLTKIVQKHGFNDEAVRVGMHVNVHAESKDHAWMTCVVGSLLKPLSWAIGGRGDVYSTHFDNGLFRSYPKPSAVAMRYRTVDRDTWSCPLTGALFPVSPAKDEWRNEFRNHKSFSDFYKASRQVRYSLLVSRFARDRKDFLQQRLEASGLPVLPKIDRDVRITEPVRRLAQSVNEAFSEYVAGSVSEIDRQVHFHMLKGIGTKYDRNSN